MAPNAYTYSALLKAAGECGQWQLAEALFNNVESKVQWRCFSVSVSCCLNSCPTATYLMAQTASLAFMAPRRKWTLADAFFPRPQGRASWRVG